MPQTLFSIVRQQVSDFEQATVSLASNWSYSQFKTLEKIDLYYNSQYESGEFDSEGFKKFFYNINRFPCDIETKATDLDSKDFRWIPDFPAAEIPTLFITKEVKQWMRQNYFGKLLNDIIVNRPVYGTVVIKKSADSISLVNLRNLYCDPTAEKLKDGPVLERHVMSPDELRLMPWDPTAIEEVIANYQKFKPGEKNITIWEGYRWIREDDLLYNKSEKMVYGFFVVAGVELIKLDSRGNIQLEGAKLLANKVINPEVFPYRENHRRRIKGRWLGVGKVEELFDPQIKLNELENIETKIQYWTGKVVFQSRDETVVKNLLLDVTNGDILKTKSEIAQVPIRNIDAAAYNAAKARWDALIQRNSFTFESVTGESLPSGTPFRLGALLAAKGGGFFDFQREQIGLFLKELFFEEIIPSFKKDKQKKHLLTFVAGDKDRERVVNNYIEFQIFNQLNSMNLDELANFDIETERQRLKISAQSRKNFHVEIPDGFYDDAKFSMELVITDEALDLNQRLESLSSLITLIAPNPGVLNDPRVKALVFAAMESAGFNPDELGLGQIVEKPQPTQPMLGPRPSGLPPGIPGINSVFNQTTA